MGASLEPLLLSNKGLVLESKGMFHIPSSNGLWKKGWTAQSMRRRRVQGRRRSRRAMRSLMKRRALSEGSSTRPRVGMQKRVRTLKKLVPNGKSMGLDGLFQETADYILTLEFQVRVMQIMVGVLSGSNE